MPSYLQKIYRQIYMTHKCVLSQWARMDMRLMAMNVLLYAPQKFQKASLTTFRSLVSLSTIPSF